MSRRSRALCASRARLCACSVHVVCARRMCQVKSQVKSTLYTYGGYFGMNWYFHMCTNFLTCVVVCCRARRRRHLGEWRSGRAGGRSKQASIVTLFVLLAKGSVESTHKVPTSHYHTKHCPPFQPHYISRPPCRKVRVTGLPVPPSKYDLSPVPGPWGT